MFIHETVDPTIISNIFFSNWKLEIDIFTKVGFGTEVGIGVGTEVGVEVGIEVAVGTGVLVEVGSMFNFSEILFLHSMIIVPVSSIWIKYSLLFVSMKCKTHPKSSAWA